MLLGGGEYSAALAVILRQAGAAVLAAGTSGDWYRTPAVLRRDSMGNDAVPGLHGGPKEKKGRDNNTLVRMTKIALYWESKPGDKRLYPVCD